MAQTVLKVEVILSVPSIEETADWYERVLGWSRDYDAYDDQGHCTFGSVTNGKGDLPGFNLSRAPEGATLDNGASGYAAFVLVDDVDALCAQVVESGVASGSPPEDQFWGGRTFSMKDINGFELTFYSWINKDAENTARQPDRPSRGL